MVPVILFALSATSDSFVIGFNFGARNIKIPVFSNLIVTLICFSGTYLAMAASCFLSRFLPENISVLSGAIILMGLGFYMCFQCLHTPKKNRCDCVDSNHSQVIEWKEAVLLGILLCCNNMGAGIGAGISGLSPVATSAACSLFSFLFLFSGHFAGCHIFCNILKKFLELGSAAILIGMGTVPLFRLF